MKKEKGYQYHKIKSPNLRLLEILHDIALDDGWEKVGDVDTNFWQTYAYCWYRKPNSDTKAI